MKTLIGFMFGAYCYNEKFRNDVNKMLKKGYNYLEKELNKENKDNVND